MSTPEYLAGLAYFVPILAASGGVAFVVVRNRLGHLAGLHRFLAYSVVATATLVLAHIVPAAFGVLGRGTALGASLLLLVAAVALTRGGETAVREPSARAAAGGPVSIAIAAAAFAAVVVVELARARVLVGQPLTHIDMLNFHLPGVARWIQTGTLWRVDQFVTGFATAQYPGNGDIVVLSTILPWHDLAFARLPGISFLALAGVAVYALGIELGTTRASAVTFAAVALASQPVSRVALDGLTDDITLAMLAIGTTFLIRHGRSGRSADLALAGVALGLSLGTKWYGLTAVGVLLLVWVAVRLIMRSPVRALAREGIGFLLAIFLGGGVWLVRNLIESGNPVYPKAISIFGLQVFQGSRNDIVDRFGYTIVDYLGKPDILRKYILAGLRTELGLAGAVVAVGLVVALVLSARTVRRQGVDRRAAGIVLALVVTTLALCAVYVVTPGSAYGPKDLPIEAHVTAKWLTAALVLGAAICAWATTALRRPGILLELAGLAAVADAIRVGPSLVLSSVAKIAFLLVVLSGAGLLAARRMRASGRQPSRATIFAAAGFAAVVLAVAGRADQRTFDRQGYAGYDPVFAWIEGHAASGHRIGITGATDARGLAMVLPAFGPRLGNTVTYVGEMVRHSVQIPRDERAFQAELRRGRYELLLVGLKFTGKTDAWARTMGYRLVAHSPRMALYAAPGSAFV